MTTRYGSFVVFAAKILSKAANVMLSSVWRALQSFDISPKTTFASSALVLSSLVGRYV